MADQKLDGSEPWPGVSWEEYEIARDVARWIMEGKPNKDRPEVREWLCKHGYGHYLNDESDNG